MTSQDTNTYKQSRGQALQQRFGSMLNEASILFGLSVGHRTGLFDAMDGMEPSTSVQIAAKAGLDERYVREWLSSMYTGGIVDYEGSTQKFNLPKEHADLLTRRAYPNNMAVTAQFVAMFGTVEDEIVERFKLGGGVPYTCYHRFHDVMAEESSQSVLPHLTTDILPSVPGLMELMEHGINVMDIGCGKGKAILLMAKSFPKSNFVGYDISQEALAYAEAEARAEGLTNVSFVVQDLSNFHNEAPKEIYDLVTAFDAIHDQGKPQNVLDGIYNSLKHGGVFFMKDINGSSDLETDKLKNPMASFLYTISYFHCMSVSLAQDGGVGLGTMWGEKKALEMLSKAGFPSVKVKTLPHDTTNFYYTSTK